ncbi:MAG: bifunctional 2-C-methyl-D-erythritol 4-phosphate cytidylyltransferase/2-C-methyl-D-erythritol 2,4-cyclodiphosphate synthase [Sphingomonadaceae bacterium]
MTSPPHNVALIVAAGKGTRIGGDMPKQYCQLGGKAMIAHSVDACLRHPSITAVHIVIGEGQNDMLTAALAGRTVDGVIIGGAERQDSVRAGLVAIGAADHVLIHDAARPMLPAAVIDRLLTALETAAGAVPVLPIVDTLAERGDSLGATVDRATLVRVQTPQAFRFDAIMTSHRTWAGGVATDDAQMARAAGFDVALVEGDIMLEKVTHAADFASAEARLGSAMISRTGFGYDVHRLEAGQELWLCGMRIDHDKGLSGHSDADVALHALTDALLGAISAGDIGDHFPPSDPQWRGAASSRFVDHAVALIAARGARIANIDLTIICEAPRIGPHRAAMRARIADLLRVDIDRVSVKATTTERLGFTGRGEGIAAQAVATISERDM